ncbi:MAG: polyamine aminopropyltransferase [Planctomycetota bacterium]|nr:polyamine aminopropyltransferase [Planctomycetota bacterium]
MAVHREKIHPSVHLELSGELLVDEHSEYQHIKVLENPHFGAVLVLDNVLQTTERDSYIYHEAIVHVPLCGKKTPAKRVLIIGGGDLRFVAPVLLHDSVERVVMCELDSRVVQVAREYFPFPAALEDERAELVIGDGVKFVREFSGEPFDAIIVDSSDITTLQEALYTRNSTGTARDIMTPDGVMIHQSGLPEQNRECLRIAVRAMRQAFEKVAPIYAPVLTYGECIAFTTGSPHDISQSKREMRGKWYSPRAHSAYFATPALWDELL